MVAYYAADLLWATRIKATAQDVGVEARPVRSVEMLRARLADSDVRGLVVDLESPDVSLELIKEVRALPEREKGITVVAFGPHAAVEAFDRAKEAGADVVLARGAFDRRLGEVLRELDGN